MSDSVAPAGQEYATLTVPQPDGTTKTVQLPIRRGKKGPPVIEVGGLHAQTGFFTHDPGFTSTSACESKITFIDGANGKLLYRGYNVKDLSRSCDYLEVVFLLFNGSLPTKEEYEVFRNNVTHHTLVHVKMCDFIRGFRADAHPMAIMCGVMGALSAFYNANFDLRSAPDREMACLRIVAKMPTLAAMAYKHSVGQPFVYPINKLGFAENFLHMMFSVPCEDYHVKPVLSRALETIFVLHADHGQNASTSTVRIAGSSLANPFACIAAGIASLWGPAHGGANEAVLDMLEEIGDVSNIPDCIAKAKDKSNPFRLMGFGHRVYKNMDPRAAVMRETCHEVLDELGIDDPLLDVAMELERACLADDYFKSRRLYPNVDFYSGIVLRAMGIPKSMFTVLFAVGRSVGWIAHWKEMISQSSIRIGRPRQLYLGSDELEFVPLAERESKSRFERRLTDYSK